MPFILKKYIPMPNFNILSKTGFQLSTYIHIYLVFAIYWQKTISLILDQVAVRFTYVGFPAYIIDERLV